MKLTPENYYGSVASGKRLENFHISITTYKNQVEVPLHSHENPYVSLNLGCSYHEIEGNSEIIIQSGEVVYRPSNYEHRNIFSQQNGVCLNIEIIDFSSSHFKHVFNNVKSKQYDVLMHKVCVAYINNYNFDELDCLIYESLANENEGVSLSNKIPNWYRKIIDYINDQYTSPITLALLSEAVNAHPNYISRKFKKINGLTIGEYIRKVRLERAFGSLTQQSSNLTQVSLAHGFYDQSHFSRTFRDTYKSTPKKFTSNYKKLISYN